jgi:hypothetical protein
LKQRPHVYVVETRHVGPIVIFRAQVLKLNDIMSLRQRSQPPDSAR